MYSLISLFLFSIIPCNALNQLSFSGGGAFGAVEIGILNKIRDTYTTNYDIYTGISAGGINAAFLSHFEDIDEGIAQASTLYATMKNTDVYSFMPPTHVSILNTNPLQCTMRNAISNLNPPVIPTYIGATNLHSGELDIFKYHIQTNVDDMVNILLCTSAIPIVFPPISFNNAQYADGGMLQNELLSVIHDENYLNITFITPFEDNIYDDSPIETMAHMAKRTFDVVKNSFNNEFNKLNKICDTPTGEIHRYYVNSVFLKDYDMLNFNDGQILYKIGYNYTTHDMIYIC